MAGRFHLSTQMKLLKYGDKAERIVVPSRGKGNYHLYVNGRSSSRLLQDRMRTGIIKEFISI